MKNGRVALIVITAMMALLMAIPLASAAPVSDDTQYKIVVSQIDNHVSLSLTPSPTATVYWDLDNGDFRSAQSLNYTYDQPGLYKIKAVIIADGKASIAQKHIGIYSASPPIDIQRNSEYRYAVYNGSDVNLTVKDADDRLVSGLTYDSDRRIVTGVLRTSGTYHAVLTGIETIEWTIQVVDGPTQPDWIRFAAHSEDGDIVLDNLYSSSTGSLLRYTWTLSDFDGSLISASEGRSPNVVANPGVYKLLLKAQGMDTYSEYAQFIVIDGDTMTPPETSTDVSPLMIIFLLSAVITVLFFISTRDPRALFGTILSIAAIGILLVI